MRHNITLEGAKYRLRPVTIEDAPFILALRTDQQRNQYLGRVTGELTDQENWLEAYFERDGDYYFVIENVASGAAEGLISLYEIDSATSTAEWGRWIIKTGSNAAVESAFLIYTFAFEKLGLHTVYCRTIINNAKVCSFHDSCGLTRERTLEKYLDNTFDAVEHKLDVTRWNAIVSPILKRIIARA